MKMQSGVIKYFLKQGLSGAAALQWRGDRGRKEEGGGLSGERTFRVPHCCSDLSQPRRRAARRFVRRRSFVRSVLRSVYQLAERL